MSAALGSVTQGHSTLWLATLCGALVAVVSHFVHRSASNLELDAALASMGTFLIGVLLAFTIARTTDRLALVQSLLSKGNADLLSMHQLMQVFSEEDQLRIRDLIDRQLTDQIDYPLRDNHRSAPSHYALANAIYALVPQNRQQEVAYKHLVSICIEMGSNRSQIEAKVGQSLSVLEWSGLLLLLTLLMTLFILLPGGAVLGSIIAGVMSGALVSLMVLLRRLDLMRWHERTTIWEPTERLFRSMGRDPYIPRHVIDSGRFRPTGTARVVDYIQPYPNRSEKSVVTVDFDASATNGAAHTIK